MGLGTRSAIPHPRRSQVAPMEIEDRLSRHSGRAADGGTVPV